MKRAIVESVREVCSSSVKAGRNNPKSVWWHDALKAVIKRKEDAWNQVWGVRDEAAKER